MSQQPVRENTIGPGLVNETLLFRKQLRRLYRGTVWEFLRELFQNSDRAGARKVALAITAPGRFTYRDDGTGLVNGLRGLFDLLCIANSAWEDESVEPNQLPMGLGFYALIVNPKVRYVRIQSNTVALDIDTARFLDDPAYRNGWVERVEKRPATENPGFFLLVEGEEDLSEAVCKELREEALTPKDYWVSEKRFGPARGYAGRLEITLDGQQVEADLPDWFTLRCAEIVDTYQGSQNPHLAGGVGHPPAPAPRIRQEPLVFLRVLGRRSGRTAGPLVWAADHRPAWRDLPAHFPRCARGGACQPAGADPAGAAAG